MRHVWTFPLQSQYILSLALFVIKNMEICTPKSDIHTKNTRNKFNLFLPQTRLTKFKKGVYFAGTKIFNYLPENLRNSLITQKILKGNLRNFFYWAHFILLKNIMDGHPREIFMLHIFKNTFQLFICVYYKVSTPSTVSWLWEISYIYRHITTSKIWNPF